MVKKERRQEGRKEVRKEDAKRAVAAMEVEELQEKPRNGERKEEFREDFSKKEGNLDRRWEQAATGRRKLEL
jgi:hypothetical protein